MDTHSDQRYKYHGDLDAILTGTKKSYRPFDIQERRKLIGMLKIELIETADAGQDNTVLEPLHIAPRLTHHLGKRLLDIMLERQRLQGYETLRELVEGDGSLRLLAPLLGSPRKGEGRTTKGGGMQTTGLARGMGIPNSTRGGGYQMPPRRAH